METALFPSFSPITTELSPISLTHFLATTVLITALVLYFLLRSKSIYLVDFTCYLPPESLRVPASKFIEHIEISGIHDKESVNFQAKVLERSGIGSESCMPVTVHEIPSYSSLEATRKETELVLFTVVEDLLSKHNINPKSIDILVSNCSLFCPTPSISSMVINKFGFRSNIKSISLGGMGCSAGILSISLAKDLLKVHKNSLALVLSMEAVTPNGYNGKRKSMLLPNILFRMGGAAILLSNRKQDEGIAKYELQHLVRTHIGSDDQAYESVFQQPDEAGHVGVSLSRELVHVATKALRINLSEALVPVATKALRINISKLGPLVLPYSEQLRYVWSVIRKKLLFSPRQKRTYVPNFKKALQHFCIHAGGRAVIDGIVDSLKLDKEDGEASRMTLHRFGNTSSSSVWYELCYLEAKGRMKKGNRVWQIAFGSGFKCNSAIWKCISDVDPSVRNAWSDRIYLYPVDEISNESF
ncbi:3-ketoacyl-CoA synthase 7-like [Pyrus ussuriensis x Pyrus communis]|uniref:3-ketoacyl-CoA synthase n=1 Tax=Pyrus ussuriensis x Pyrus communis TaxID=2448454 RepID=A0A5N5HNP5_9ROSA|nr:3-ketoacyl-CoA synthase 7-like [Pyrus ussuriensis x Pyrus communis]